MPCPPPSSEPPPGRADGGDAGLARAAIGRGVRVALRLAALLLPVAAVVLAGRMAAVHLTRAFPTGGPRLPSATPPEAQGKLDAEPPLTARDRNIPRYPSSSGWAKRVSRINGVKIVSHVLEARERPSQVVDYYLEQMDARGWTDITEEYYGISPENDAFAGADIRGQSAEARAKRYERIREQEAVFRRGGESLYLHVEPRADGPSLVHIMTADTPDLRDLWAGSVAQHARAAARSGAHTWYEVEDICPACPTESAMRFVSGNGSPDELLDGIAGELAQEGWRALPPFGAEDRFQAGRLLTRGNSVAVVTASPNAVQRGSDALVTFLTTRAAP